MPREVFIAGQILTAAEMNTVSDQTVMSFAGTAARGSAIPSPVEGMTTYIEDSNSVQVYDGSAWKRVLNTTGSILQVVSVNFSTAQTTTSTAFQSSGLTATITPSSTSSKVLILAHTHVSHSGSATSNAVTLFRGTVAGTNLGNGAAGMAYQFSSANYSSSGIHLSYLDSPNTVSAQTYTFGFRSDVAGQLVTVQTQNSQGTMTLMEVAA